MDGQLKSGTVLVSDHSIRYKVINLLGAGGQGEVYDVEADGKHYALKWYFKKMATVDQKRILDKLIDDGKPDSCFLWPQDMIFTSWGEPFGYIMPLRPKNYRSIVDMMKRRTEPSFLTLCRAAYNMTNSYQKLHAKGYSYRDISFGNLFFDPDTGDVLICDNDNIAPSGDDSSSVYGTPRFMAPEIVRGEQKPSTETDLYSLAVLLFYMFMMGHPLDGALEASIKCMDLPAMNRLYGTNPVFIFDPENANNRPVPGYHDNVITYWGLYPQSLKDLFTRAFTDGLIEQKMRIPEKEWLRVFVNLISGIVICPHCGAEVFYDALKTKSGQQHTCWNCGKIVDIPNILTVGRNQVLLTLETQLYAHHIDDSFDMSTEIGCVVQNPINPSLLGLRNHSQENWVYIRTNGSQTMVPPGKSAAIISGTKINFGPVEGTIQ